MVYGKECTLPVDLMFPDVNESTTPPSCGPEYVEYIKRALQSAHSFAREHLRKAAVRQKKGYDAHARSRPSFQVGDYVRYYYPPSRTTNKFARPWVGPFVVTKKETEVTYEIKLVSNPSKIRTVHIDNLKPFEVQYGSSPCPDLSYEPGTDILDDHPDHLDSPQADESPADDPLTAPELLQSQSDERQARDRVRRTVRPPKRYSPSPDLPRRPKVTKQASEKKIKKKMAQKTTKKTTEKTLSKSISPSKSTNTPSSLWTLH